MGDEKSLQRNINHKDIYKYTLRIPYPYKLIDAREWVRQCILMSKKRKKRSINLAIEINRTVKGGIGLENIEGHKAEIGYWLGKKYWNFGIMTKAVKLVTNFGLNKLKLRRIFAYVFPQNAASAIVLEKNGYEFEGLLRKHHIKNGRFIDAKLYAKTK